MTKTKQKVKYTGLLTGLFLFAITFGLNQIEIAYADKAEGSPGQVSPKSYGSKTNNIVCGDVLCDKSQTNKPIHVEENSIIIQGQEIFYLEAGKENKETILLLHGFPTSSHMYRNLIPALADEFHLVAPDYVGYGRSSMPAVDEFEYTFENQAKIIEEFTEEIGLEKYNLYVMDYGAPIGFRIASENPEKAGSFIVQNGNAYDEGLQEFWDDIKVWWYDKTPENEKKLHHLVTLEATKWQYTHGTRNSDKIDPSNWETDQSGLDRPGNASIQLAMLYDYKTNVPLYPQWQQYFQEYQPPMLITWGANDYIFPEIGAHQYERDLNNVEKYILDTGHFALEEDLDFISQKISNFLD